MIAFDDELSLKPQTQVSDYRDSNNIAQIAVQVRERMPGMPRYKNNQP